MSIVGDTGVSTTVTSNTVTIGVQGLLPSANANEVLIYDGGAEAWTTQVSSGVGFDIGGGTSTGYSFTGGGYNNTSGNPTIYVYRGFTYRFNNLTGVAHPFALRQTNGGSAVTQV